MFVLESENTHRKKDIDHRNLISLTGSPKENNTTKIWKIDGDQVILRVQMYSVNDLIIRECQANW